MAEENNFCEKESGKMINYSTPSMIRVPLDRSRNQSIIRHQLINQINYVNQNIKVYVNMYLIIIGLTVVDIASVRVN